MLTAAGEAVHTGAGDLQVVAVNGGKGLIFWARGRQNSSGGHFMGLVPKLVVTKSSDIKKMIY